MTYNYITETDFVKSEIAVWGEDYVFDLIERGYKPILTDAGWYWLLDSVASDPCAQHVFVV